ncbi:MAG: virulence-associated protein VapB [Burkholderiaceae bacterium]|nr:virulence-associated protein VapB [Burkholderiaceae bacterium]
MNHVSDNHAPYAVQTPSPSLPTPEAGRHVRLFRNGANQAVRIPKEFEMPGVEAILHREGTRLILEPVLPQYEKGSPAAMLAMLEELRKLGPCDDEFPDVDEGLLPLDDINL